MTDKRAYLKKWRESRTPEQRAAIAEQKRQWARSHPRKPLTPEQRERVNLWERQYRARRRATDPQYVARIREGCREFYASRKDVYVAKKSRASARRTALRAEYIRQLGGRCAACGFSGCDAALDFDHIDPSTKQREISSLYLPKYADALRHEIAKCQLLCANCHREKTWKGAPPKSQEWIGGGC